METEEDHKLEETLLCDTSSIAPLDTSSTFNLTNNENVLTKTAKAKSPIMSKRNVRKKLMDKHGITPGLMDGMCSDEMLMITIVSFSKPSGKHRMQCDNKIGESFQVHNKVGMTRVKQSEEGS